LATDRIKVSQLPLINSLSLSKNDVFIINDSDRGDGQTITSGIKYSDVISSLTQQELNFTGELTFESITINGLLEASVAKISELEVNEIKINESIVIEDGATIKGIKLRDLDDTAISVPQRAFELLVWNLGESSWINYSLQEIVDNLPGTNFNQKLDDLIDVRVPDPVDGRYLQWNQNTQQWIAAPVESGAQSLNDLLDVSAEQPIADRRFLMWDQVDNQWVPANIEATDIVGDLPGGGTDPTPAQDLNDLGDVDVPSPLDNESLVFSAATGNWVAKEVGVENLNDIGDVNVPNPLDGDALVYDANSSVWLSKKLEQGGKISVSSDSPVSPSNGDLWFDNMGGILYLWDQSNDNWIDTRPGPDSMIRASGYDINGSIDINDLDTTRVTRKNDQFIIQQSDSNGKRTTRAISWDDMLERLSDKFVSIGQYNKLLREFEDLKLKVDELWSSVNSGN